MSKVLVATFNVKKLKVEAALNQFNYPKPVVVRMGGIGEYPDYPVQINSVKGTWNCINKWDSKNIMLNAGLPTLPMYQHPIEYPFVIKGIIRSRGSSVFLCESEAEYNAYKKILRNQFYVEPLFPYTSEYRLHCTKDEVFFAVKKKKEAGREEDTFITADNHQNYKDFEIPRLWKQIKEASLQAVKKHKLDIGCVDIGYCSKGEHSFVIHELNTSPELRQNTFDHYITAIDKLIREKL